MTERVTQDDPRPCRRCRRRRDRGPRCGERGRQRSRRRRGAGQAAPARRLPPVGVLRLAGRRGGSGGRRERRRAATIAMAIYAFSLSALLGTSALYHRVNWAPGSRRWMRRLDHTMIFVLIAGTYTPFALLVMHGTLADVVLIAVWAGGGRGRRLQADLGRRAEVGHRARLPRARLGRRSSALPQLVGGDRAGRRGADRPRRRALHGGGGRLRAPRPDPNPAVFGYHEIFHLLVIAAAAVAVRRGRDLRAARGLTRRAGPLADGDGAVAVGSLRGLDQVAAPRPRGPRGSARPGRGRR